MLASFSIRTRLIVLISLPLLALVLVAAAAAGRMERIDAGLSRVYDDHFIPLRQLKNIADDYAVLIIDAVNKANTGLFTAEEALADVRRARTDIRDNWQQFLAAPLSADEKRQSEEAQRLLGNADAAIDRLEQKLQGMHGKVSGQLDDFDGPLYQNIDPISAKVTELIGKLLDSARDEREAADVLYHGSVLGFALGSGGAVLLVALFGIVTYRSIAQSLGTMRQTIEVIAREQDLTRRVPVPTRDELGATADAVNAMLDGFRTTLTRIAGDSARLAAASEELSVVSRQTNEGLRRQQAQTEQAATAMNQMAATVHEVASNATVTAHATQEADHEAEQGGRVLGDTLAAIRTLAEEVDRTAEVIRALDAQSVEIGSVLVVIGNIAEQTNLLALNAAIEAARAGDQGRGFAVVADEVRTLALRTQKSTGEIQEMIVRLQNGTKEAVKAMQVAQAKTGETVDSTNRAGAALQRITQAIATIRDMSTQIASAAEQQGAVAEEINRNIAGINSVTAETASGADQTAAASQELASLAGDLQQQIGHFRI